MIRQSKELDARRKEMLQFLLDNPGNDEAEKQRRLIMIDILQGKFTNMKEFMAAIRTTKKEKRGLYIRTKKTPYRACRGQRNNNETGRI